MIKNKKILLSLSLIGILNSSAFAIDLGGVGGAIGGKVDTSGYSLVDETCNPELNLEKSFNDVSTRHTKIIGMLQKQFSGGGGSAESFVSQEQAIDALSTILTNQKCVQNLSRDVGSLPVVQQRVQSATQACTREFTQGALEYDTKTLMGTTNAALSGAKMDVSKMANIGTCTKTRYNEVFGDLFDNCYTAEKQNTNKYLNDLVESVNKQSQKDLELQHEKCKLDKQNFETKNKEIKSGGTKTVRTAGGGGGNGSDSFKIVVTNSRTDKKEVDNIAREDALAFCQDTKTEIFRNFSENTFKEDTKLAYTFRMDNWCKYIFAPETYSMINDPSGVEMEVPNGRWAKKIHVYTQDSLKEKLGSSSGFEKSLDRIRIEEECRSVTGDTSPLMSQFTLQLIEKENNKPDGTKGQIVTKFPVDNEGKEIKNRFYYVLGKYNDTRNNPTISSGGSILLSLEHDFLTREMDYWMQQVCVRWANSMDKQIMEKYLLETAENRRENLTSGGKRMSARDQNTKSEFDIIESLKIEDWKTSYDAIVKSNRLLAKPAKRSSTTPYSIINGTISK